MTAHDARLVGAYELPYRHAPDKSLAQMQAEAALGAVADAGLSLKDVDGFFCGGDTPGMGPMSLIEYLNITPRHVDSTETGGNSYVSHVARAARAIDAGLCDVALITLAGKPRTPAKGSRPMTDSNKPDQDFELTYHPTVPANYALAAQRHMYEYGTTSEQLAWIKVAASHHAQHNPHALLKDVVTVEDVVNSPMVASPLHRFDCCVITDGGGALILARSEIAKKLNRPSVKILGTGEAVKHQGAGDIDLTWTAGKWAAEKAWKMSGCTPDQIQYASIYDSFTITVLLEIEDLGFCKPGHGGGFVAEGNLISGKGKLPFNTDGGGLCSNHPGNRGGMTKVIEAVRQLRGEAHPAVQVPDCALALAHGTGGSLGTRHGASTLILARED